MVAVTHVRYLRTACNAQLLEALTLLGTLHRPCILDMHWHSPSLCRIRLTKDCHRPAIVNMCAQASSQVDPQYSPG